MKTRGRPRLPGTLTPRQQEVLALLREGLTNEEIAARLGISLDGAKFHVSEILLRLGVDSRYEAATWRPEAAPQPARGRWAFALAPLALLHKLKWNAAGAIVASALTLAAAAGMALLIFGLVRTNDDRAAVRIGAQSTPAAATQLYENALYGIELRLPASWVPDPGYGQTGGLWNGFVSPHGSAGGFMRLDGVGAGSLDAAVDAEAYHKLKPYGDAPVIRSVQLAAGDGVIITPDPTNVHLTDAVLVMPMPRVYGSGGGILTTYRFPYFDLYARASDIDAIAQSLRFTDPGAWVAPPGPPVASSAPGTEQ